MSITLRLLYDTGASGGDLVTAVPTLAGRAPAFSVVYIRSARTNAVLGTATADAQGDWSFTPGGTLGVGPSGPIWGPADGVLSYVATNATQTLRSNVLTFTLDRTAPAVTVSLVADTGASASDGITSDPRLMGTAVPNGVVAIQVDGVVAGTATASSSGAWTFAPASLAAGAHTVTVSQVDLAGNVGVASRSFTYVKDATVSVAAAGAAGVEGSTGQTPYTFTVTRSGNTLGSSTVAWSVVGVGANPADAADFVGGVLPGGVVRFAPGQTSGMVTVNVAGDRAVEANEGFAVALSAPSLDTVIGVAQAAATILNDDSGFSVSSASAVQVEGDTGLTALTFTVTRTGATSAAQAVSWAVNGAGTFPISASDLHGGVMPGGVLRFAAGEVSKTITVYALADGVAEADETLSVTLSAPSAGAQVLVSTAVGAILNDDTGAGGLDLAAPQVPAPAYVAGELLVQFAPGVGAAARAAALSAVGGSAREVLRDDAPGQSGGALLRVALAPGLTEDKVAEILARRPDVQFAEKNWIVRDAATSNDVAYTGGSLWGMYGDQTSPANAYGSQAGEAWTAGAIGAAKMVVGVIDTGIAYAHQDLYLNVWLNQREIPSALRPSLSDSDLDGTITFRDLNHGANSGYVSDLNGNGRIDAGDLLADTRWENGLDDDANGYRDDLIGWDFVNNDNDPFDDNNHGTHVSGTIGAMGGNGTGVVGVAWSVAIMGLKFLGADGSGAISNAALALDYYTSASKVASGQDFVATNNSWGGGGYSSTMQGAIDRTATAGNLFIAAAGNSTVNTDATANYPSNYSTLSSAGYEAVISVASITSAGGLSSFSNYGSKTVDLGAPGSSIYSTLANGTYGTMSGTSMATPHVTGAAVLYAAQNPTASAAAIRDAMLASATPTDALAGKTVTGGRLDVQKMLAGSGGTTPVPPPSSGKVYGTSGSDTLTGTAADEFICGVPELGTLLGKGTKDLLTGGGGNDIFALGDARGVFYNDGSVSSAGTGDYAQIMDFRAGDKVQVSDDVGYYFIRSLKLNGYSGVGIYADTDASGSFGRTDELVAHLVGVSQLSGTDFIWA